MNIEVITNLIGSFGFPIVMCLLLWLSFRKDLEELKKTVDNNSKVVQSLLDHLNKDSK